MLELWRIEGEAIVAATLLGHRRSWVVPESVPMPGMPGSFLRPSVWPPSRGARNERIGLVGHLSF
jgi:hypothetical protein